MRFLPLVVFVILAASTLRAGDLKISAFRVDATPPIGSPLCNGAVKPVQEIVTPLTARGVVLLGAGKPIVLCAFDWVGIGNETPMGTMYGVNLGCLDDVTDEELSRIPITYVDGRDDRWQSAPEFFTHL